MKCPKCQTENQKDSKFCSGCGGSLLIVAPIDDGIRKSSSVNKRYAQGKNPVLAAFLSFPFAGLGQIYNGEVLKGAILLVAVLFLVPTGIGAICIWGFAAHDAYQVAKGNRSLWK